MQNAKPSKFKIITIAIFVTIAVVVLSALIFVTFGYISIPLNQSKLVSTNLGIEIYDSTTTTSSSPINISKREIPQPFCWATESPVTSA